MDTFNLNYVLLKIGSKEAPWTVRNSFEGLQIFGGIGSGKTSGSARFFALKYLSAGYGGLVLTVKPNEKDEWIKYCELANRENDVILLEPNGKHFFNFLHYESTHSGKKSYTENILQVLKTVIRASEQKDHGKSEDQFWETSLDMLISNTIELCFLAYEKITVDLLYEIAHAASATCEDNQQNDDALTKALKLCKDNVQKLVKHRLHNASTEIGRMHSMTSKEYDAFIEEIVPETRTAMFIDEFFTETYANLNDKTKSIISFSFTGFLYRLLKEPVYSLFCTKASTFTPEDCLNGKIIIINLPVKLYQKVGRDVQIMFKYIWQRAMEKRNIEKNKRPVFLFADEAQNFLHEYDPEYQATARSSRIATVYISQNLHNYHANMGGTKAEHKVKSFLGTLATKIFHANADIETNKYASELIGETFQEKWSEAQNTTRGTVNITKTVMLELMKAVRPEQFASLVTGGENNNWKVTGYIHVQGLKLTNDQSFDGIAFDQRKNYTL